MSLVDVAEIQQRVNAAISQAREPHLVGFDANGIQDLVTANGRPLGMRGASALISDFGEVEARDPTTIFAGGGRGLKVVSRDKVSQTVNSLVTRFRTETSGGVLAAASVPFDPSNEHSSLAWLQLELAGAKDAAEPPAWLPPRSRSTQCADCGQRDVGYGKQTNPKGEPICTRCERALAVGRKKARTAGEKGLSLADLAPENQIAAVSADGNDMGPFFSSLGSLAALAAGSLAVAEIFRRAHETAAAGIERLVAPVTGGDDVRCFFDPGALAGYVERLARTVEELAGDAGSLGGLLSNESASRLARLGIGVGAVVAHDHFPAARLMEYAHEMEVSAKSVCRSGYARSAFDLAILSSGDEFLQGAQERIENDGRPYNLDSGPWEETKRRARALLMLPSSQRARAVREPGQCDAEFLNAFRDQVARSSEWQAWYERCGLDWCDKEELSQNRPSMAIQVLATLLGDHP